MKYSHEDKKLNALLGKKVEITFDDYEVKRGILEKSNHFKDFYKINNFHFRKSHIRMINKLFLQ